MSANELDDHTSKMLERFFGILHSQGYQPAKFSPAGEAFSVSIAPTEEQEEEFVLRTSHFGRLVDEKSSFLGSVVLVKDKIYLTGDLIDSQRKFATELFPGFVELGSFLDKLSNNDVQETFFAVCERGKAAYQKTFVKGCNL